MALDWNKEISFSGLAKRKPKAAKATYPSKRFINLMPRKERTNDPRKLIPLALLLVLLVGVFVKFGIYDFYAKVHEKQAELSTQTQLMRTAEARVTDYNTVKEEYDAYESTTLSAEAGIVSATEAMNLVDTYIAPVARIGTVEYKENTISLTLSDVTLDQTGQLVNTLYDQNIVSYVSVSTAAVDESSGSETQTVAMAIALQRV